MFALMLVIGALAVAGIVGAVRQVRADGYRGTPVRPA